MGICDTDTEGLPNVNCPASDVCIAVDVCVASAGILGSPCPACDDEVLSVTDEGVPNVNRPASDVDVAVDMRSIGDENPVLVCPGADDMPDVTVPMDVVVLVNPSITGAVHFLPVGFVCLRPHLVHRRRYPTLMSDMKDVCRHK